MTTPAETQTGPAETQPGPAVARDQPAVPTSTETLAETLAETETPSETAALDGALKTATELAMNLTEDEQVKSVETSMEVVAVPDRTTQAAFQNLPRDIDTSKWPAVRVLSLRMQNFGPHEDVTIEFGPYPMHCLVGPNGSGKTTTLTAVQLLFGNFSGYARDRYHAKMLRLVRNWKWMTPAQQAAADFSVTGTFEIREPRTKPRQYTIALRRQHFGFIGEHPGVVRFNLPHYCFMSRFDQELHMFQVRRNRWDLFKELFEAVTGFVIEEDVMELDGQPLSQTGDRKMQNLIAEYVMGFRVRKEREIITQKQCSAGERKIAKSLSTILNKPAQPNIILIDNVTDHVELARHLPVMNALERCFPDSQILATCHSQPVQRRLPNRDCLIDLRFLTCSDLLRQEPWRMRLADEVSDSIDGLGCVNWLTNKPVNSPSGRALKNAQQLTTWLTTDANFNQTTATDLVTRHLADTAKLFVASVWDNSPEPRVHTSWFGGSRGLAVGCGISKGANPDPSQQPPA